MTLLVVTIPGEPVAQGRPRGRAFGGHVVMHDPPKSRSWKGAAQVHYREALRLAGVLAPAFPSGPVELHVLAVFTCPRSQYRKRDPLQRRPKSTKPDSENIGKAVMDAGNGLLFMDDAQVARLTVEKIVGAQDEAPRVEVTIRALVESARPHVERTFDADPGAHD